MAAWFITGTGTDVGKTFVTAGLVRHLRGQKATAIKPVMSGVTPDTMTTSDGAVLLEAMGGGFTWGASLVRW